MLNPNLPSASSLRNMVWTMRNLAEDLKIAGHPELAERANSIAKRAEWMATTIQAGGDISSLFPITWVDIKNLRFLTKSLKVKAA